MSIEAEIFSVGTWNGDKYEQSDLEEIAHNFERLRSQHKPPLKLGHNEKQAITDGQPALGWVSALRVAGGKLIAKFEDMPQVVLDAIKAKRYRRVSAEFYLGVALGKEKLGTVLKAVALLGADIPAVSNLADLGTQLMQTSFAGGQTAVFTTDFEPGPAGPADENISTNDGDTVSENELAEQVKNLTQRLDTLAKTNEGQATELATLKAEKAQFTAKETERAEAEAKAAIVAHRTGLSAVFEEAVKSHGITPAQREAAIVAFGINDDARVMAVDIEAVRAFVTAGVKKTPAGEQGLADGANPEGEGEGLDASQRLADETNKLVAQHKLPYSAASEMAMRANPELAAEYRAFTLNPGGPA